MVELFGILIVGGVAALVTGGLLGLPRWWRVLGILALGPFGVLLLFFVLATWPPCLDGSACAARDPGQVTAGATAIAAVCALTVLTAWRTHRTLR